MFVLFGINTRTKQPERVTQGDSWHALRRMWSAYTSAAIGDLEGSADDVETKPGTDRTHVAALTRAIVRAQREHRRAEADDEEPSTDRDAKPANVPQPATSVGEPPAPRAGTRETPAKLPPLHRHANDNLPCPVADCGDPSAPYTASLPTELRALCKRHRDNAQANRSKGMTVADALETVLANGRARLARANAAANKPPVAAAPEPAANAVEPRMVADAPGPQVERASESDDPDAWGRAIVAEMDAARLRRGEQGGQVLRMDRDPPPVSPLGDAALAPIFDRLDAVATAATVPTADALTRADFAAVLRGVRDALDVAIARLESPR